MNTPATERVGSYITLVTCFRTKSLCEWNDGKTLGCLSECSQCNGRGSTPRHHFHRQSVCTGITPSLLSQSEKMKSAQELICGFRNFPDLLSSPLEIPPTKQTSQEPQPCRSFPAGLRRGGSDSLPNMLLPTIRNEYIFPPFAMHLKEDC